MEENVNNETGSDENVTLDDSEGNRSMNNNISSKSLLALKSNDLNQAKELLEMNIVAGIELLAILWNSGASTQLYDKIVKWLEDCIPHKLTESLPTRECIIKKIEVRHNLQCIAPVKTAMVLPLINLPIGIPINPLLGCIFSLLSNKNLMQSENLIFPVANDPSQFTPYNGIYSEVNISLSYQSYQQKIRN